MTKRLDPNTRNNDVGLYFNQSRRVDPAAAGLPQNIPDYSTGIRVGIAGTVVWENWSGDPQISIFEAGEWLPLAARAILASATIDGQVETTTVGIETGMLWTASPADLK